MIPAIEYRTGPRIDCPFCALPVATAIEYGHLVLKGGCHHVVSDPSSIAGIVKIGFANDFTA